MSALLLVAGAGPAGLAAAARTRHVQLTVLERMKKPGYPPHCTGIVSEATAAKLASTTRRSLHSEEIVEAVYREAVFLGPELRERCSIEAQPLAVKLARPRLEQHLALLVENDGHRIVYGARLLETRPRRDRVEAVVSHGGSTKSLTADRVLIATGAQDYASPPHRHCWRAYGLEERVELATRIDDEKFTTIHGTSLAPRFFAWLAPIAGGREAVVGLAAPSPYALHEKLEQLKKKLARAGLLPGISRTVSRRGGVILRGPPKRKAAKATIAWLGDTLCASKPYTGGGLYAIAALAGHAAGWLEKGDPRLLQEPWARLRRELLLQHIAARAAVSAPRLFLRLLSRACRAAAAGRCRVDYDRHSSLIGCLAAGLVPVRV